MSDRVLSLLIYTSALGSCLVAGIFFAFSVFVMEALKRLPAAHGIAAMQSINVTVINPVFMLVFMGTAAVCVVLAILSLLNWGDPRSFNVLAGCLLYVIGCFGVTMIFNVPLNDALAAVQSDSAEGATVWNRYLTEWTNWNHVRTAASLAASVAFFAALR